MKAISDIAVNEHPLADQDRFCDDETGTLERLRSPVQNCAFLELWNLEKWTEKQ